MSTAIRLQTRSMYLIPLFKDPSHEELQGHCGQQRKKYSRLGSRVAVVATYRQPQLQLLTIITTWKFVREHQPMTDPQ